MTIDNYKSHTFMPIIIKAYLFVIPILSLMNSLTVRYGKVIIITLLFSLIIINYKSSSNNTFKLFFVLFVFGNMFFAIRNDEPHFIFIQLGHINFYFIFISNAISPKRKKEYFQYFIWGIMASVFLGGTYMLATGIIVKGGTYTINNYNISNLDLPVVLSTVIIYIYYLKVEKRVVIYSYMYIILIILMLLALMYLDKRLPIFTAFLGILYVKLRIKNKTINTFILLVIFIYPVYSIFIYIYSQPIFELDLFVTIFKRNVDLVNYEYNPRIVRIIAASSMLQNISLTNILYYPEEILTFVKPPHNHFHNLLLQLYYERGLITVLSLFLLTLISVNVTQSSNESKVSLAFIMTCLLIGTNESFMPYSIIQFCFVNFVIINYGLSTSKDEYV
jgi:hypothetical protein